MGRFTNLIQRRYGNEALVLFSQEAFNAYMGALSPRKFMVQKYVLFGFLLLFLAISIFGFWIKAEELGLIFRGQPATAKIENVEIRKNDDGRHTVKYDLKISYAYNVNGTEYHGLSRRDGYLEPPPIAIGEEMPILYSPSVPTSSTLQFDLKWGVGTFLALMTWIGLIGGGGIIYLARRYRNWASRQVREPA